MKADLLSSLSSHGPAHRVGVHAPTKGRGHDAHAHAFATALAHADGVDGAHDPFAAALAATNAHKGAGHAAPMPAHPLSTSAPMSAAFDTWASQRGLHGLDAQSGLQNGAHGAWSAHGVDAFADVGAHVDAAVQRALGTAAAQLKVNGPALPTHDAHDVEDSLWSERTTASGKATATKKRSGALNDVSDDVAAVDAKRDEDQKPGDDKKPSTPPSQAQSWTLSTMTTPSVDRVDAVRDVPPGPLTIATDHLRALLPEGGRVLAASAHHVSLELPHQSGPMLLEVSLKSGIVDVRARGGAAAEMAWRVPELAAALQSAGVRLGSFEVAPMKKSGDAATTDDGPAGDRQNSDDLQPRVRRPEPRGVVSELAHAFSG